jgi:protein transport protein SEC24
VLPNGRRQDADVRPELYNGSVDYVVGDKFRHVDRKKANPLANVYLIDVSFPAQKSGVTQTALGSLRSVIEHLDEEQNHQIGIVTYSDKVHCYDCSESLSRPRMLVLAEGSFSPVGGLAVPVKGQSKKNLLAVLDLILSLHEGAQARQECEG